MPSLKQYRNQIASVKNTRKITQAMKMVAAAKLKKAQERAQASQPFASAMAGILGRLAGSMKASGAAPKLLSGTGRDDKQLFVVISSDRGLCGGFNANLIRFARQQIQFLQANGKQVELMIVGRKARDVLRREYQSQTVSVQESGIATFEMAEALAKDIVARFNEGGFDVCTLVYNEFKSVLAQKPSNLQLIPFQIEEGTVAANDTTPAEFEPSEEEVLAEILPRNLAVQIFRAMLDSAAGEHAARMTAMDNATRNAGEMIRKLSLAYNRARQAYITKELIEIISGAEAV
jgi:F-type H+-transporting ATPase subunit gamma